MSKLPSLAQSLTKSITEAKARLSSADNGDFQFLKLEKSGTWVFGADDVENAQDDIWAIDPNSLMTGYIAWPDEGEPLGEEMASILDEPILKSDLPDVDGKWTDQVGMQLRCVEGVNAGTQAVYKTTAKGGTKAFKQLLDEILVRATAGETELVPLVYLDSTHYKHKKYGKIFTPIFEIEEWTTHEGVAESVTKDGQEAEPEQEPEQEKLPEPTPEPEKEAPKKRTRRSRTK